MLSTILLVFAFVLFVVAGALQEQPWRSRLICFGLACWTASEMLRVWK